VQDKENGKMLAQFYRVAELVLKHNPEGEKAVHLAQEVANFYERTSEPRDLSPEEKEEQAKKVKEMMEGEDLMPKEYGQVYHVITMEWWQAWQTYVGYYDESSQSTITESQIADSLVREH